MLVVAQIGQRQYRLVRRESSPGAGPPVVDVSTVQPGRQPQQQVIRQRIHKRLVKRAQLGNLLARLRIPRQIDSRFRQGLLQLLRIGGGRRSASGGRGALLRIWARSTAACRAMAKVSCACQPAAPPMP